MYLLLILNARQQKFSDPTREADIVAYQILVVQEEPILRTFSADVTADVTSLSIPAEFLLPGVEYKYEVLAIEASGNQTLSERGFTTADPP